MEFWFYALAASLWTPEDHAAFAVGKLSYGAPQVRAILQAWLDANAEGWISPGANPVAKFVDEYETFERSEAAMTIGLSSDVAHWKEFESVLGPETMGAFTLPAPGIKIGAAGGIGYAVNARSAHADRPSS